MVVEFTASTCTFCGGAVGTAPGQQEAWGVGREEGRSGHKKTGHLGHLFNLSYLYQSAALCNKLPQT